MYPEIVLAPSLALMCTEQEDKKRKDHGLQYHTIIGVFLPILIDTT